MKVKKLSIAIALVMVLISILGGCGQKGDQSSDKTTQQPETTAQQSEKTAQPVETAEPESKFTTDKITITQWTFLNPADEAGRGKVLNDLINRFQSEHPNVTIKTEVQNWNQLLSKQTAAFYAGNAPDIMWNSAESISGILNIGAYEPFENLFLDEWTAEDIADVDDALWGSGTKDGKHYFFDIARSPFGIAYRADLFEKYGIGTEYNDITDFFQALTAFNGKVENGVNMYGYGAGYNVSSPPDSWLCIGLASAGELFNDDGTAKFATETGVQMLELQKAMIDDYKITPDTCFAYDNEALYNDFCAGKYGAIPTSAARVVTIRKNATFDPMAIQVMPYPSINGNKSKHITGGWCVGVSSKSEHKYEAGKFVELLGGKDADWALCNEGGQVAVRKSTYVEHADFFKEPGKEYLTVLKEIMDNNIYPISSFPAVGLKETTLEAFSDYYLNKTPAMDVLQKAETEFNARNKK